MNFNKYADYYDLFYKKKNYSDEVAIWTELDIEMPKDFYSLCEHCYVEEIEDEC